MKLKSTLKNNEEDEKQWDSSSSSSESGDDGASTNNNDSENNHEKDTEQSPALQITLAKRESKAVLGMRFLVFGVLIVSTIVVAVLVYYYTSNAARTQFETSFVIDAAIWLHDVFTVRHVIPNPFCIGLVLLNHHGIVRIGNQLGTTYAHLMGVQDSLHRCIIMKR